MLDDRTLSFILHGRVLINPNRAITGELNVVLCNFNSISEIKFPGLLYPKTHNTTFSASQETLVGQIVLGKSPHLNCKKMPLDVRGF